ncbi:MAG: S-layer homology domain-containing protein [Eubacteriales bacterium]|nr:S-layer homology domain-containing protein [Eubacteriales bacterium]
MKKILGIVLAISLVFTASSPAFAAEMDSKGLEQAILKVKNVVSIPADYEKFEYTSSQYESNGKLVSVWNLNWYKEDHSSGISASIENDGYLVNFNAFTDKRNEGLGSLSRAEGQIAADAFLTKARPDVSAYMKSEDNQNNYDSDRYYYRYRMYQNDAIVGFVEIGIEVDKYTGEVTGFNFMGTGEDLLKLPSSDGTIGIEAAKKAYLEEINVDLNYYSYFDYESRVLKIFPAYSQSADTSKVIDAKTGKAIPLYNDYYYGRDIGGMGSADKAMNSAAQGSELTREELAAVENISNLIPKDKAETILRAMAPGITPGMKVTNLSLSKSYVQPDLYLWEIGFDGAYGVVNAKSGELVSFYIYHNDSRKGNLRLSEEKAREQAENFMKKNAPEKFDQSRFYENPEYSAYKTEEDVTDYSFNYYRQVNGIDFVGNGFTVIVNKASGMITHYDCNWYDEITFPEINGIITDEAAFDLFNETGNMTLMYKKVKKGETGLVYDFADTSRSYLLNPFDGSRIGWDGKLYKETSIPVYTDIQGHWAEATINKLLENGYYRTAEKFEPNKRITQLDFLRYLYSPIQSYYEDEDFYKMLVRDKIVKEDEKDPATEITRQDASKFIIRFLGQGMSAEHPEIFKNPFKDNVEEAYKGYAAISHGLKIMQGDKSGRFNGTKQVTNAEAAIMIYNALQVK